jgi:hypothetical protein
MMCVTVKRANARRVQRMVSMAGLERLTWTARMARMEKGLLDRDIIKVCLFCFYYLSTSSFQSLRRQSSIDKVEEVF